MINIPGEEEDNCHKMIITVIITLIIVRDRMIISDKRVPGEEEDDNVTR